MPVILVQGKDTAPYVRAIRDYFNHEGGLLVRNFERWRGGLREALDILSPSEVALVITEVQDGGSAPQHRLNLIRQQRHYCPVLLIIPAGWQTFSTPRGMRLGIIEKPQIQDKERLVDLAKSLLR